MLRFGCAPVCAAVLALVVGAAPASAQDCDSCGEKVFDSFTWENDGQAWILRKASTDHFYTNGLRLSRLWRQDHAPGWARLLGWPLERLGKWVFPNAPSKPLGTGYTIGQNLYTPSDLLETRPIIGERPYGGWLYVGSNLVIGTRKKKWAKREAHFLQLDVGIIGQGAGGRASQATAHLILNGLKKTNDTPDPKGWHNQIRNQPALQLSYRWTRVWAAASARNLGRVADFTTSPGFIVGHPFTLGAAAAYVRAGYNVPRDLGPFNNIPAATRAQDDEQPPKTDSFELFAFAGAEGRGVAHSAFLDCGKCRDVYQIEKRTWVGDWEWGVGARLWKLRITWRRIRRSAEFRPSNRSETVGSWNLTWVHTTRFVF